MADVTQLVQGQDHRFQSSEASSLPLLQLACGFPSMGGIAHFHHLLILRLGSSGPSSCGSVLQGLGIQEQHSPHLEGSPRLSLPSSAHHRAGDWMERQLFGISTAPFKTLTKHPFYLKVAWDLPYRGLISLQMTQLGRRADRSAVELH